MSEEREDYFDAYDQGETPERDAPYDAGEKKHVKKREKASKIRAFSDRTVLRQIMGSREGRAWMYQILTMCHSFNESVFSSDALIMACSEGQRMIGIHLSQSVMLACPERYMEMMKEANDE